MKIDLYKTGLPTLLLRVSSSGVAVVSPPHRSTNLYSSFPSMISKRNNTDTIQRELKKSKKSTSSSSSSSNMAIDWGSDYEGKSSGGGGGGGNGVDARERHKLAERERRKSMRELFLSLHSLLPHSNTVRKEQSAILDEIIKYIPIAAARLRSLQTRKDNNSSNSSCHSSLTSSSSSSKLSSSVRSTSKSKPRSYSSVPSVQVSDRDRNENDNNSATSAAAAGSTIIDCDIRVAPEPTSSVAIRIRGDRVNVSLSDTKGTSQTLLLSAVLDELENHQLQLVRSTHCRDGSKVLHHSESKICDGLDKSPSLLKSRLQELARKLHKLRKSTSLKRTFDQVE